jgi:hypothetical protein
VQKTGLISNVGQGLQRYNYVEGIDGQSSV